MDISPHDPYCDHLATPNPWVLALSVALVLGILFSYLPQHIKIIQKGTSAGLSPYWVLLGTLSSIAAISNVVTLPTSQHDMACCKDISGAACGAALLGIVQIGVQWACFMTIMVLFLMFFPREGLAPHPDHELTPDVPDKREAIIVGLSSLVAILFALIGSLVFLVEYPHYLLAWANFLGICSSVLSCVQYLPQLFTTWKLKKVLSLSITTMIVQVPGSFLFAFSLWLRVGWQGWSTWLVYCVTGLLQGGLLAMAISFWLAERSETKTADIDEDENHAPSESDPLMPQNRPTHVNGYS